MRGRVKRIPQTGDEEVWFAWRPVFAWVDKEKHTYCLVWRERVRRRLVDNGLDVFWEYYCL